MSEVIIGLISTLNLQAEGMWWAFENQERHFLGEGGESSIEYGKMPLNPKPRVEARLKFRG